MLIPLYYNLRSLKVRRGATLLTALGIGATVAVVAGVLALQQGFATLYSDNGQAGVAVFLRPGAITEGLSTFGRAQGLQLVKSLPEIAAGEGGQPLASMECMMGVRRFKTDGGETNVTMRGVQPETFEIRGDALQIVEGRTFTPGTDEVIVGRRLVERIRDCRVGDVLRLNVTPFTVVGVFECDGPFESEVWGDLDRMLESLELYGPNRVIAQLDPGTDVAALDERLSEHKETPADVWTESAYLASQTEDLSGVLIFVGAFLGLVMGIAAVFMATNTMLAALAARTHEIGILLATGFRPFPIFLSFMFETMVLGLLGGLFGCLLVLPINGIETGTTNFATFTEIAFAFRVTPPVLVTAIVFSLGLGLLGGALPAWRAARLRPTQALGRH
jgi:putative ABC transport system permease protein